MDHLDKGLFIYFLFCWGLWQWNFQVRSTWHKEQLTTLGGRLFHARQNLRAPQSGHVGGLLSWSASCVDHMFPPKDATSKNGRSEFIDIFHNTKYLFDRGYVCRAEFRNMGDNDALFSKFDVQINCIENNGKMIHLSICSVPQFEATLYLISIMSPGFDFTHQRGCEIYLKE